MTARVPGISPAAPANQGHQGQGDVQGQGRPRRTMTYQIAGEYSCRSGRRLRALKTIGRGFSRPISIQLPNFDSSAPALNGSQCVLINPGSNGTFASGDAPTCNGLWDNPDWYQCYPTGPPGAAAMRDFRGIELLARETIGQQLWLQASYLYSSLRGNYNPPAGVGFRIRLSGLWHEADGNLPLDRTNRFRFDGYWTTPWQVSVGLQAFAETGAPLSKLGDLRQRDSTARTSISRRGARKAICRRSGAGI